VTVAQAAQRSPAPLTVLWRFSRPHTIVGTLVSVLGLYAIAGAELASGAPDAGDLGWTLLAALSVNLAIVGLNQLTDVEIDRINKPDLPIAAGTLSASRARTIVAAATALPVALAITQGPLELTGVVVALVVSAAYSLPPVRLKGRPVLAAVCISGVRSLVVNLVVFGHFAGGSLHDLPDPVWALTAFVIPFSLAIAILKDVPDAEGDRHFRVATFTVRAGPQRAAAAGMGLLVAGYVTMAVAGPLLVDGVQPVVLAAGHLAALVALLAARRGVDVCDQAGFTRFYLRVWALFFAEYALVSAACLLA